MTKIRRKKVTVGLSGGVDSAVAAAILKDRGYEVTGVFLSLWKAQENTKEGQNSSEEEVSKICEILDIPFAVIDARERFKKEVVGYFLREYEAGRTPNPCIFCNKNLKFRVLFEEANKLGADYAATGHYAKVMEHEAHNMEQKRYGLFQAFDKEKDQSYFLYTLTQEQLAKTLFPLGDYTKSQVRELAREFRLPVADKVESQDICFLSGTTAEEFLRKNIKSQVGKIIDVSGKVLGQHTGLSFYTLGQRKGICLGGQGPYYVLEKNYKNNTLVVTNKANDLGILRNKFDLEEVNWISGEPDFPFETMLTARYHNPLRHAIIKKQEKTYTVELGEPERAVTSGQSAVFYSKEGEVIGGGVII